MNAWAGNYFFYDGIPLFKLSGDGKFETFSLLQQDAGTKQVQLNQGLYQQIPYVWSYHAKGNAIRHAVSKLDFDATPDACVPRETIILKDAKSEGLMTTLPLPAKSRATQVIVADERREAALKILDAALIKRRVTPAWRARLLEMASVHEIQLHNNDAATLLVQLHDDWKQRSISALLLLTKTEENIYLAAYSEINIGGPSGSEPEAARIVFIDHLATEQNDSKVVLLRREGYETTDWLLLKQAGVKKPWQEIARRETGC
ncbi:hypothetical protein UNDYM_4085 [Undibacterium sp. YM2]|uniref:hypothetical protein n=1 Tax=Undibacterium sp. YM2 TaxID=2058625 RepID=UPI001331C5F8|nr:hypothetical protein [Undibacterium sp. YM2]BBB68338.1 hypothetical protein UNDYM_4085 [Undibacterium sp. YM2]